MAKKKNKNITNESIGVDKMTTVKKTIRLIEPAELDKPKKISFSTWYYEIKNLIPRCHLPEAILASFKARGLTENETPETYNKALALYGIDVSK